MDQSTNYTTGLSDNHRHLLVCCTVTNASDEVSIRYVEHSLYRLWQYTMANKHGIVVRDANVCLWLPDQELLSHEALFQQAGSVEEVHRISFANYEPDTGLCNTMQRFVAAKEVDHVRTLLLNHIPEKSKGNGDFAMETETGHAVINSDAADLRALGRLLDTAL